MIGVRFVTQATAASFKIHVKLPDCFMSRCLDATDGKMDECKIGYQLLGASLDSRVPKPKNKPVKAVKDIVENIDEVCPTELLDRMYQYDVMYEKYKTDPEFKAMVDEAQKEKNAK